VVNAVSGTFPDFDRQLVRVVVHALWADFDVEKVGALELDQLMKPQLGLIDTAQMQLLWNR